MICIVCNQDKDNISPLTANINSKICEDCIDKQVAENEGSKTRAKIGGEVGQTWISYEDYKRKVAAR